MQAKIIPVILCGGSGKRLLPFLRYDSPKQFLDIFNSSKNLFQETILRFTNESFFSNPIVI
jgi:mannose-1-phosphate guanylyltransferase